LSRLGPLRLRAFRLVFLARATSSVGDALIFVAAAFAVLHVGGTASDLGLLLATGTVVRLVLLLVGGVWADRLPRQLVMLSMDAVRGVVEAGVGVLLITGNARLWHLFAGFVLHSAASAFFGPASDGLTPQLVPRDEIAPASALLDLTRSVPAIAGPVVSGVIVAAAGAGWVFVVDAVSFLLSALCLAAVRLPPREPRPRSQFLAELREGWHAVASRPWYWQNLVTHAMWNFAWPFFSVLGPVIAARSLGGAGAWGAISGATGAGFVVGSLVVLRMRPARPLVVGNLALTLAAVPLLMLAGPLPAWAIAAGCIPAMAGLALLNALWSGVVGARLPEHVLSRANSIDWVISLVVNPAGLALAGPLAAQLGFGTTLVIAAAIVAVPSFLVTLVPSVRGVTREPPPPEPAAAVTLP